MSIDSLANRLRALADPCRLRLLLLCAAQPATVCALATALGETEPTVSRHLKLLAAAGVLRRARRGQHVEYSLAPRTPFDDLIAATLRHGEHDDERLAKARTRLLARGSAQSAAHGPSPAAAAATDPRAGGADDQRLGEALALVLAESRRSVLDAAAASGGGVLLSRGRFPIAALQYLAGGSAMRLLLAADTVAERTAQRRRLADAGLSGEVILRADLPRWLAALPPGAALCSCLDLRAVRGWAEVDATLRWLQRLPAARSAEWLLFDYDGLEVALGPDGGNLPLELRARLARLGFDTRRIEPVEVDRHHRLFVHCAPRSAAATRAA